MGMPNDKSNYKKMNDVDLVMGTFTNILNTFNTLPTCFYGKYTRFGMGISKDGKLQLHIAKAIDPDAKGKPVKGQNRYDTPNQVSFTLDQSECYHLATYIPSVKSGDYEDPGEKNEKFKNTLKFTHYSADNRPSMFSIAPDKNGKLKVTIKPSDSKLETLQYVFNQGYNDYSKRTFYEENIFMDFVKYVAKESLVELQMFKAKVNVIKGALFDYCTANKIFVFESSNNGNKNKYHNKNNRSNNDDHNDDICVSEQDYRDDYEDQEDEDGPYENNSTQPYSNDDNDDNDFETTPKKSEKKKPGTTSFADLSFG